MNLEAFLRQESQAGRQSPFHYLQITEKALAKCRNYACLVAEEMDGLECLGFLLAEADETRGVVVDAILAHDQRATRNSVETDGGAVIKAGEEILALGKRAIGFWHSHPGFRPYHSPTDDEGFEVLVDQVVGSNCIGREAEDVILGPETSVSIKGKTLSIAGGDLALELLLKDDAAPKVELEITGAKLRMMEYFGFAYSLVVATASYETYAEITVQKWGGQSLRRERKNYQVELNVLYENEEELLQEIREKIQPVRFSGWSEGNRDTDGWEWISRGEASYCGPRRGSF